MHNWSFVQTRGVGWVTTLFTEGLGDTNITIRGLTMACLSLKHIDVKCQLLSTKLTQKMIYVELLLLNALSYKHLQIDSHLQRILPSLYKIATRT